ncbi:MAG: alpha/beta hydrolase [bacterium]
MSSDAESAARALLAQATRRTLSLPQRGVETALLDWGGRGPLALLHHANGFCKGLWAEVADALRHDWHVVAMDARGHGDSSHPESAVAYAWDQFAEDLVAVGEALVREQGGAPIGLGIGHSFGGTSMVGGAARRPALFERLLLVDPVVPPPLAADVDIMQVPYLRNLVDGARKRRAHWPSRAAARAWCGERRFFDAWRAEAIELYLLDGMHERADGSLELKCPGAVEATIFGGSHAVDLLALAARVPTSTRILWAAGGYFPRAIHESLAAAMHDAQLEDVDCGHLVPMERPDLVVAAV